MTINEIIEYVMHTPENTNSAILKEKLEQLLAGDGEQNQNRVEKLSGTYNTLASDYAEYFGIISDETARANALEILKGNIHVMLKLDLSVLELGDIYLSAHTEYDPTEPQPSEGAYTMLWTAERFYYDGSGYIETAATVTVYCATGIWKDGYIYKNWEIDNPIPLWQYGDDILYELTLYFHPLPESQ